MKKMLSMLSTLLIVVTSAGSVSACHFGDVKLDPGDLATYKDSDLENMYYSNVDYQIGKYQASGNDLLNLSLTSKAIFSDFMSMFSAFLTSASIPVGPSNLYVQIYVIDVQSQAKRELSINDTAKVNLESYSAASADVKKQFIHHSYLEFKVEPSKYFASKLKNKMDITVKNFTKQMVDYSLFTQKIDATINHEKKQINIASKHDIDPDSLANSINIIMLNSLKNIFNMSFTREIDYTFVIFLDGKILDKNIDITKTAVEIHWKINANSKSWIFYNPNNLPNPFVLNFLLDN